MKLQLWQALPHTSSGLLLNSKSHKSTASSEDLSRPHQPGQPGAAFSYHCQWKSVLRTSKAIAILCSTTISEQRQWQIAWKLRLESGTPVLPDCLASSRSWNVALGRSADRESFTKLILASSMHTHSNLLMFALTRDSGRDMKRGGTAPTGEKRTK